MNFQDVLRDVHDPANHSLKTSDSGATVFAVVNTAAAGDSVNNIGFATVSVSNPTLYAVVNTGAAGVGNSIVTIANTPLDTQIIGNVTLSGPIPTGLNNIGFATVAVSTPTLYAVVNTSATGQASVVIDGPVAIKGNITLTDSKGYIGLVTVGGGTLDTTFAGNVTLDAGSRTGIVGNITLSDPKDYIGLVTVTQASSIRSLAGNVTIQDGGNSITVDGNVGILGNITINSQPAWTDPKTFIGLVTVGNTIGTTFSGNVTLDPGSMTGIVGNLTLSDPKGYIGLVTATMAGSVNTGMTTIFPGPNYIGLVTADIGTIKAWDDPKTYIGLVTVANTVGVSFAGNVTLDAGSKTGIVGNVTLSDSKSFIGLTSVSGFTNPLPVSQNGTWNVATVTAVTDITNPVAIKGNVTISDSKTYIGLTTSTLGSGIGNIGFATVYNATAWPDPKTYIGLVTVTGTLSATFGGNVTLDAGSQTGIVGNVTLSDSKGYIGLVTVGNTVPVTFSGNVTLDDGSLTGIVGNVTISDSKGFIGLTTAVNGQSWPDPKTYIGLVTATMAGSVNTGMTTIFPGPNYIGLVTADIGTIKAWPDPKTYIGLVTVANVIAVTQSGTWDEVGINDSGNSITVDGTVTANLAAGTNNIGDVDVLSIAAGDNNIGNVDIASIAAGDNNIGNVDIVSGTITTVTDITNPIALKGNITLSDAKTYIGLTTTTLGIGTTFIGLVTANSRNAGTTKTLISLPFGLGNNSIAVVATPTNANRIHVTNMLLSSNITTEIAIKSGVTYLTGNASLGVTLFPGGGFELPGSPDSPSWIGLPSGALTIEKRDPGGTVSKIGGGVIYFDE